ncbi:hypothetical protein PCK1_002682 [Pneumocystis canis]|nr:hypothetical protein PCK1_002682 [Pneumocystis canis]
MKLKLNNEIDRNNANDNYLNPKFINYFLLFSCIFFSSSFFLILFLHFAWVFYKIFNNKNNNIYFLIFNRKEITNE